MFNVGYLGASQLALFYPGMGGTSAPSAQTLVFREMFSAHEDVTPANPRNFDTVTGLAKARRVGPRVTGLDAPGWSARVRGALGTSGDTDAFVGRWDPASEPDLRTCGMLCAWFRLSSVNIHQAYTPLLRSYVFTSAPFVSLAAKQADPTSPAVTLAMWEGSAPEFTGASEVVSLHEWFFGAIAWSRSGASTTIRALYMPLDGVGLTQLGSDKVAAFDGRPDFIEVISRYGVFAVVSPWSGCVGGVSAYALDSIDDAATYPTDLTRPVEQRHVWCMDEINGSDTNTGLGASAAWQTTTQLNTELLWGTPLGHVGGIVDSDGDVMAIADVTNESTLHQFGDDIESGEKDAGGDIIHFLTDCTYARGDTQSNFEHIDGLEIRLASGVRISSRLDITGVTWTQPSSITHPRVWKYTATGLQNSRIIEAGRLATGLSGVTLEATALTELQAGPAGATWFNSTGAYLVPFSGSNPNDSISRQIGLYLTQTGGRGMLAGKTYVVRSVGSLPGILDGGPTRDQQGSSQAQYCCSRTTDGISVIQDVICDGGSVHAIGMTGTGSTGVSVAIDVQYRGTFQDGASQDVEHTSAASANIFALKRRTTQHADGGWHADGEEISVGVTGWESWLCHGEGAGSALFKLILFEDCEGYRFNANRVHPSGIIYRSGILTDFASDEPGALVDRSRFEALRVQVYDEDVTVLNCIMHDEYAETNAAYAIESGAELVLNFTTLDTRDFAGTSDAIWSRAVGGSPRTVHITNSAIIADGAWAKLLSGFSFADDIVISNCAILGHANPVILKNYNDGSTTSDRTYLQCVALNLITNSVASADILLDDTDNYRVMRGSPVRGVADPESNFDDYTGMPFVIRDDAGAREQGVLAYCMEAGQTLVPGMEAGQVFVAGATAGQVGCGC